MNKAQLQIAILTENPQTYLNTGVYIRTRTMEIPGLGRRQQQDKGEQDKKGVGQRWGRTKMTTDSHGTWKAIMTKQGYSMGTHYNFSI